VVFTLEIPPHDPQYKSKLRFLSQGGGGAARRKFQIPVDYKEKVTREAFSFLRFAYAKVLLHMSLPPFGSHDMYEYRTKNC
jgi:hypothetical protein